MSVELSASLVAVGVLQTILYLLFIRAVDLYERESFLYVVPVFVWGFTVAVLVALVFNSLFQFTVNSVAGAEAASFLTAVVGAPVIEESAKGLALILIFGISYAVARMRRGAIEFSGVMDGIVYGSAVGFGFAIAEDLLYYAQFGPEVFITRRIFGGFAHAAFTSVIGVGVGLITWVRSPALKILLPLIGLAGAILLHALFNLTASLLGPLAYVALFVVVLFYVLLIALWLAVERRTIRGELREEVHNGTIKFQEYQMLPTYFRRSGYYLRLIFSGRLRDWRRARKIHAAAIDLAFSKRIAYNPRTERQEERVRQLREKIRLHRVPVAAAPGP